MSGKDLWDILGPMLDLSVRTFTRLKRAGIYSIEELTNMTPSELKKIRNLGSKSYEEILSVLEQHGLHLKEEDPAIEETSVEDHNDEEVECFSDEDVD